MAEKKIIKIQTDSDGAENDNQQETDSEEKQDLNSESLKPEAAENDEADLDLEAKLKSKAQEAEENYDRLLRVSAEFENYKKRSSREMEDFRKFANQSLIKEMLSVVDNLELAMNSTDGHKAVDKSLLQGLEMTHREILKVFEKFNVKPIDAKGQQFNPAFHEAVMQEENDEFDDNMVVNELQKGYLIHDRLLRPAMVVVAKSKSKKNENKKLTE
jgi:molecular chaperone GrpE